MKVKEIEQTKTSRKKNAKLIKNEDKYDTF